MEVYVKFHDVPSFFLFKQILKWTSITDEGYDNGFGAEGENGCNVTHALVGDQRVAWELLLPMRSAYWVISFQIVVRELNAHTQSTSVFVNHQAEDQMKQLIIIFMFERM